ncbi:hypothetical protein [Dokdonella sp.]|uniref:hypothetical protein n=1 Tax=Dokdonella sp. TaxID=2291710 RepID=UPI0027BAF2D8|nr:hypothetical protein [Dokdonella sp.]
MNLLSVAIFIFASFFLSRYCFGHEEDGGVRNCLMYGEQKSGLVGVISASPFKWPTREKSDHYASFTLHLDEPLCVLKGKDNLEADYDKVENIELGIIDAKDYRETNGIVGSHVRCSGNLQPAISGYHVNSIILWRSACINRSIKAGPD